MNFLPHYIHFYLIYCFHDQRWHYIAHTSYCTIRYQVGVKYVLKIIQAKYMENEEIVLGKGLFTLIKGHLCFTKEHLDMLEQQVEVKSPWPWYFTYYLLLSILSMASVEGYEGWRLVNGYKNMVTHYRFT